MDTENRNYMLIYRAFCFCVTVFAILFFNAYIQRIMTKKTNPHAWFYAHLQTIEGYKPQFADVIKEGIIHDYSGGKTESLSELYEKYPRAYARMRSELSPQSKQQINIEYDQARKKLIAAIFANLEGRGYKPNMEYVKAVACKAAKIDRFNDIPLPTLKAIYRRFVEKNLQADVDELLKSINFN